MPTFDPDIRKLAERLIIKPRAIDSRVGVFASEVIPGEQGKRPVTIKMIDAKTKQHVETLEVDACLVATGRVPNTSGLGLEKVRIRFTLIVSILFSVTHMLRLDWRQHRPWICSCQ